MLADDGTTLVIREGKRLRAVPANRKLEASDPAVQSDTPSRKSGWIDLGRVRVSVDPRSEWRQMLREVWRLQRDHFWTPNMSGIDWNAVYERYAPLLDRVATRGELSDLIWEMQGELGTSHAYEMGGDHRKPPSIALGHLAAELKLADDGASYEIVRIVAGDPWEAGADSPLNAVGVEAQVGDRIVAVNGLAGFASGAAAGAPRASGGREGRAYAGAEGKGRGAAHRARQCADRRGAGALSRMGRAQSRMGARAIRRPHRLLPPAGHAIARLRRIPSLFQHRMRPRCVDRRPALQPRRPRVAAAAGEDRPQAHRLQRSRAGCGRRRIRARRSRGRSWR